MIFRRSKENGEEASNGVDDPAETVAELPPLKSFMRSGVEEPVRLGSPARADTARRLMDPPTPGLAPARAQVAPPPAAPSYAPLPQHAMQPVPAPASAHDSESKKLTVGREIRLQGEISSCDKLVVEGSVDATLHDGNSVEIAESGTFRGAVECEIAEIRGRFEGELTCRQRLMVRGSGRVVGTVRYKQLEVERGGEISGDVRVLEQQEHSAATVTSIGKSWSESAGESRLAEPHA